MRKEMYCSSFWSSLYKDSDDIIMDKADIDRFNKENIEKGNIFDVFAEKEGYSKDEIVAMIDNVGKIPTERKYNLYFNGKLIEEEYCNKLIRNLNLEKLEENIRPSYGITVRRTMMKTFPTDDRVFKHETEYSLDRFMETAVYPCEPCVVYCSSKDKKWYFAKIYNYIAWIKADDVVIGDKEEIKNFCYCDDFLMVTGKKIYTEFNPFDENLSNVQIDMGVRLPIDGGWNYEETVQDMDCEGNYVVKYPRRNGMGKLEFTNILIPFNEGVNEGYLPYTVDNILRQIFKFQGERYGWGGEFNGRDCSGLMLDVYRSLGIILPRNADRQFENCEGRVIVTNNQISREERINILRDIKQGTMIFFNGHVAMYIGEFEDNFYIIHDTLGYNKDVNGKIKAFSTRGVSVSPLKSAYTLDDNKEEYILAMLGVNEISL